MLHQKKSDGTGNNALPSWINKSLHTWRCCWGTAHETPVCFPTCSFAAAAKITRAILLGLSPSILDLQKQGWT